MLCGCHGPFSAKSILRLIRNLLVATAIYPRIVAALLVMGQLFNSKPSPASDSELGPACSLRGVILASSQSDTSFKMCGYAPHMQTNYIISKDKGTGLAISKVGRTESLEHPPAQFPSSWPWACPPKATKQVLYDHSSC